MKFTLTLFILLIGLQLNAQERHLSESEFLELEQQAKQEMNGDFEKAFSLAETINSSNNPIHQAAAEGIKSYLFQINGDEDRADEHYQKALEKLKGLPDSKEKTRTYMVLLGYHGLMCWKRDELLSAYSAFNESRELAIQLGDQYQLMKALNNMSLIDIEAKNYKAALATLKLSDSLLKANGSLFDYNQYRGRMSILHYNIGLCYDRYGTGRRDMALVDSAIVHYGITIRFAEEFSMNMLSAKINTANLIAFKGEYDKAEKRYFHLLKMCEENEFYEYQGNILFNLGLLYLQTGKFAEAEVFFKKVGKLYKKHNVCYMEYVHSNYYLAVIYEEFSDYDKAEEYIALFEESYQEIEKNYKEQAELYNYDLASRDLAVNVGALNERIASSRQLIYIYIGFGVFVIVVLFVLLRKSVRDKRRIKSKLKEFKEKFEQEEELNKKVYANTIQSFTLNDEKEKEILVALEKLIDKEYYLQSDFSLQNVAKKIKTNTTYLSHVVNKNFGKSFSEYSNELKMNYVVRQLLGNKTFQKYSTQAMAESVGYKSAVSFTRSFKKRTGLTPVQFLKNIESE